MACLFGSACPMRLKRDSVQAPEGLGRIGLVNENIEVRSAVATLRQGRDKRAMVDEAARTTLM
jgi:hypothetical protein